MVLDDLIREVEKLTVPEMQEVTGVLSYDDLFEITGSRCWSPPMEVEAYQKQWLAIKLETSKRTDKQRP